MGTRWDVHCLDCDARMGLESWLDECRQVIAAAPLIVQLVRIAADIDISVVHSFLDKRWIVAHAGHRLLPRDDAGRFDGDCGQRVACGECQRVKFECHLPSGHDGEHKEKRNAD